MIIFLYVQLLIMLILTENVMVIHAYYGHFPGLLGSANGLPTFGDCQNGILPALCPSSLPTMSEL